MMNTDLINLCGRLTLDYLSGERPRIEIHGIRIVYVDRDIYRQITTFVFENGWEIPLRFDRLVYEEGGDFIYKALVREVVILLRLQPMHLEAYTASEALVDEDPDELDPEPYIICDICRRKRGML